MQRLPVRRVSQRRIRRRFTPMPRGKINKRFYRERGWRFLGLFCIFDFDDIGQIVEVSGAKGWRRARVQFARTWPLVLCLWFYSTGKRTLKTVEPLAARATAEVVVVEADF